MAAAVAGLLSVGFSLPASRPWLRQGAAAEPPRAAPPAMGILKGISPLLTAELLYVLRSAGHMDVSAARATPDLRRASVMHARAGAATTNPV